MNFDCYRFDPNVISEDRVSKGVLPAERDQIIGESLWANNGGSRLMLEDNNYFQYVQEREDLIGSGKLKKRVFISHRQTDVKKSKWLANYLNGIGVETWLDILDLKLKPNQKYVNRRIALANMIEIALLNCTHVLALMTPKSAGSAWIPYEFGRVKSKKVRSYNAAAFQYKLPKKDIPEYMIVAGKPLKSRKDIDNWIL